ncbi:MAG: Fe-S cluster assembly protein SufD [Gammaproteobacteria bacterium]
MSNPAAANFLSEFDRVAAKLPGGAQIMQHRRTALARFGSVGFPSQRDEAWKYTNTVALARRAHVVDLEPQTFDATRLSALNLPQWSGYDLVFVDGRFRADLSKQISTDGVRVQTFADAMGSRETSVDDLVGFATHNDVPLVSLNAAFITDGAIIQLDECAEVSEAIRLVFVMTAGKQQALFPRIFVKARARSRATIVEHYVGESAADGFTNTVTEMIVDEGARVQHCRVQDEAGKASHIGHLIVKQFRASEVISHSLSFGALLARQEINVSLNAPDASIVLNGLYMAEGRQHVDHHTRIDHLQPCTRSEENYKGIVDGYGRGVFNGKVVVHEDAVKTDAQQSNRNLLLSANAEVDTKPELEIYADDVKCTHGATVGQLDEDALFYLRARGIDLNTARAMLTCAFASDVIDRVEIPHLQSMLTNRVTTRLSAAVGSSSQL